MAWSWQNRALSDKIANEITDEFKKGHLNKRPEVVDRWASEYALNPEDIWESYDNEGDLSNIRTKVHKPVDYIPHEVWNMMSPEQQKMMEAQKPPSPDAPAEGEATPTEPTEPAKPKEAPLAWPKQKSQADIEADMGRHSTGGVDWNVGLGNVGGWDLSTQGSFNRGGEDRHGIKDKDDYNVRLNATRGMDWNKMLGAAPLGGPAAKGRYSDYKGGEYKPREMGSRISTSEVARGRKPAPMAAANDPLAPYLAAGIDPDQAAMLLANKVPPPPARRAMGGPIYAQGGGMFDFSGPGPQLQQQKGLMGHALDFGKSKALDYGLETMFPGAGIAKEAAGYIAPRMFNKGGDVEPWYKRAAKYAWGTGRKGENARAAMQGQKPAYRQMGGMTPGPLGMTDMIAAGKGKDVSKVMYKKKGGEVEDTMEISYHAPLAPKGE